MSEEKELQTTEEEVEITAVNPGGGLSIWGNASLQTRENIRKSQQAVSTKHGMFSAIPIVCRGRACPYFETCWLPEADLQVGERCPIEIATILERFEAYIEELNVDVNTEIIDAGLVKDIVDIEIMMVRADGYLAKDAALIQDVVAGVSPKGQEYYKPEIHQAVDLKERLRKEKTRIMNQLNATRKDKKMENVVANDPSSVAARLMAKVSKLKEEGKIIDMETQPLELYEGGDK